MRAYILGVILLFGVIVTTAQTSPDLAKEYVRVEKRVNLLVQQESNYQALASELQLTIVDVTQQDTLARAIVSNHEEKIDAVVKRIHETDDEAKKLERGK